MTQIEALTNELGFQVRILRPSETLYERTCKVDSLGYITELNLANCSLSTVPTTVFSLLHLHHLNLRGNNIGSLPSSISILEYLKILILVKNPIKTLPAEIGLINSLEILDISQTKIEELPKTISKLNNLMELISLESPLKSPPPEIANRGIKAIRKYYSSLTEGSQVPLNEIKVIFIGDGGAGKTSLIKRFVSNEFDLLESQTHGIQITNHSVSINSRDVHLNIWDFGGQEIMHATHQFFLSKRSLYVLVLDSRKDEKVEYWLKHIESFGGNSPVLIALNKTDENPGFDINRRFLSGKYNGVFGYYKISCRNGKGINSFIKAMKRAIEEVEIVETSWPTAWFGLKNQLQNIACDYISYEQFRTMCIDEGIDDITGQETLVDFLHDLGIVLHFSDIDLLDTHVINPRWITNAVYRIINSKRVAVNGGQLKLSWLKGILAPREIGDYIYPPDKFSFIISLMLKFELCFRVDEDLILIPDLLDVQQPEIPFSFDDALNFRFDYEFFPRSIMPRFLVRMHNNIYKALCWRTGVILKDNSSDTVAMVQADDQERRINVSVIGQDRRDYFSVVLFTLRQIHYDFEKLSVSERLPLPENKSISVGLAHLHLLRDKGIEEYIPEGSANAYNVQQLLVSIEKIEKTEEEVLRLLKKLLDQSETRESFLNRANQIVQLQPNFFGVGMNLNALIDKVLGKKN